MSASYFLKMIQNLRLHEDIMLYGYVLEMKEDETLEVINFLKSEYQKEALDHPFDSPDFDPDAALWAAKTVYVAAQLILYRENKETELELLFPDLTKETNAGTILSVDLCLRFLPDMITQLKLIDSQDALIPILEKHLYQWHYSGINYPLEIEKLDFKNINANRCIHQMYINRIIENKKISLAKHPDCKGLVKANLGIFAREFWNEFKIESSLHE